MKKKNKVHLLSGGRVTVIKDGKLTKEGKRIAQALEDKISSGKFKPKGNAGRFDPRTRLKVH